LKPVIDATSTVNVFRSWGHQEGRGDWLKTWNPRQSTDRKWQREST